MDTIVALATPLGRSGIGIIRLSGDDALNAARKLTEPDFDPEPRTQHLKTFRDPATGDVIDEALITFFRAPNSFTGEDTIEISCHGSPVLLRQVIDICLRFGARMAEPGEFTLRALANGRLNLAEAEAIRDLIDARSTASARQAIRQLRGEFSHSLQPLKDDLLNVIVVLESALEFVEDDLPETEAAAIRERLGGVSAAVGKMAATFNAGKLIRDGLRVAIVGRPNVGKSSLFNALLGSERAIVTDIAGTTRDQIHERFTIGNIPVSLIDTAGLRETTDTVESIGVERSRMTMADADLVVVLLDASEKLTDDDREIFSSVAELNYIVAANKIDKVSDGGESFVDGLRRELNAQVSISAVSAKTGEGIDAFLRAIVEPFSPEETETAGFLVSDARHHDILLRAKQEIDGSIEHLRIGSGEEITLIGLHNALRYLGQITGETTTEDMLTRIFATFCIGK